MATIRTLNMSQIGRCPKHSFLPDHYAEDGTCNCTRAGEIKAELAAIDLAQEVITDRQRELSARRQELRRVL